MSKQEEKPPLRHYVIEEGQSIIPEPVCEHVYRVVAGGKTVVRYCEECGKTWLMTVLQDLIYPSHQVYTWAEILEADVAREKLSKMTERE
jgi:hypothetical protein